MSIRIRATFINAIPTAHGKKYGITNACWRSAGRSTKQKAAYSIHGVIIPATRSQIGAREKRKMTPYTGAIMSHSAPIPLRLEAGMTIDTAYRIHPVFDSSESWRKEA